MKGTCEGQPHVPQGALMSHGLPATHRCALTMASRQRYSVKLRAAVALMRIQGSEDAPGCNGQPRTHAPSRCLLRRQFRCASGSEWK